ncbi:hypothetical protein K7X08_024908 [Anisodus acutangulus]|uniref:Uncharacterized protein n=1 Tax=Anisodus acutangulus TaxID=402998 RepID=A0A9Q1MDQ7_9SOLA|nr:hypothetical protein K7X08_024908 [Anisodus acutangulus]
MPVAELERHQASVNAITWAPQSCRHICSSGDDGQALIWELPTVAGPNGIDPMSMYSAGAEINQLQCIDTTCTIWDVEKGVVETQLIAHDKEVYDIAWGEAGVFASVSADGSVRIFDLRDKKHFTIIYESPQRDTPLLRLAWNKQDLRYMATILMDSNKVVILDIRSRAMAVAELERHQASVNAIAWAPQSCRHICSAGDDGQALIWELRTVAEPNGIDPMSMYSAGAEINQLQWPAAQRDWIAMRFLTSCRCLKYKENLGTTGGNVT